MPTRSKSWNEYMTEKLRGDREHCRGFLLALLEDGDDLQTALGRFIRYYGVKEYAKLAKMEESALQRAVNPKHNPTVATLEKILAPIKLHLGAKPVPRKKRRTA